MTSQFTSNIKSQITSKMTSTFSHFQGSSITKIIRKSLTSNSIYESKWMKQWNTTSLIVKCAFCLIAKMLRKKLRLIIHLNKFPFCNRDWSNKIYNFEMGLELNLSFNWLHLLLWPYVLSIIPCLLSQKSCTSHKV